MNIIRNCAELGVLEAVCDGDLHPLEQIRTRYEGVRLFCDPESMLALGHVDAVIVAAPAQLHAALALQAIAAGKHVFVEKPLALGTDDARDIVDAARAAGLTLFVGHLLMYHPAIHRLRELIAAGAIGTVRHFRSRRASWGRLRSYEDAWWSFAPHDVAVLLSIFDERPVGATHARWSCVQDNIGDFAYADFSFPSGRGAHVEVTWLDPQKNARIDVFGSSGVLTFVDAGESATLTLTPCGDGIGRRGNPELWRRDAQPQEIPAGEPLRLEIDAFCRAVRSGKPSLTDGTEGLDVVRALALTYPEHHSASRVRLEALV